MTALGRPDPAETDPDVVAGSDAADGAAPLEEAGTRAASTGRVRRLRGTGPPADPAWRLQHAIELAVAHLARRDRTAAQLHAHLVRRGVDEATAAAALDELRVTAVVDDAAYARRYAEDRRALDGWGSDRIARHLRAAGVPDAAAAAALATQDEDAELDAALEVLRRRLAAAPADDRARDRALGILVRKGYDLELAYDAVRAFEREARDAA